MVELLDLNEDQRLYLKTIFDYFHVEGKWPTYLWVENTILRTHPEKRSEFMMVPGNWFIRSFRSKLYHREIWIVLNPLSSSIS